MRPWWSDRFVATGRFFVTTKGYDHKTPAHTPVEQAAAVQLAFWRRTNTTFSAVPIATLHANNQGAYVDAGLRVTDVCGLACGFTLVATNRASLFVIDKLKVLRKVEALERVLVKVAPLGRAKFVAVAEGEVVEVWDTERDSDVLAGARPHKTGAPATLVPPQNWCPHKTGAPTQLVPPARKPLSSSPSARLKGVRRAARHKSVRLPPSHHEAAQVIRTLATSATGSHAVVHIDGVACTALDIPAALKSEPESVIWQPAIPGALLCSCLRSPHLTGRVRQLGVEVTSQEARIRAHRIVPSK